MNTSDLPFLLLFVVLPTAVIVSGVWLVFFVLRAPPRPAKQPATAIDEFEDESVVAAEALVAEPATLAPRVASSEEDEVFADEPVWDEAFGTLEMPVAEPAGTDELSLAATSRTDAGDAELDPVAADLLANLPVEPAPEPERPVYTSSDLTEAQLTATEEMPSVLPPAGPAPPDAPDDAWEPGPAVLETSPILPEARAEEAEDEPTAPALESELEADELPPPDWPEEDDPESAGEEARDDTGADAQARQATPGRRRAIRLLPGEHAEPGPRRRSRSAGRQVPPISRPSRRDEG